MPSPEPRVSAVVLAAGAGRRLGAPKALLELRGRWMLPSVLRALIAGGASDLVVACRVQEFDELRRRGLPEPARLQVVSDPERGRSASLRAALETVAAENAVLIHPCDVPLLSPAAVATLLGAWRARPDRDRLAARLVTPGGRGGHPLLLGFLRAREARALANGATLREILHQDPATRLDRVWRGDPGPFLGVDTPEQLRLLESLLAGAEGSSQSGTDQR